MPGSVHPDTSKRVVLPGRGGWVTDSELHGRVWLGNEDRAPMQNVAGSGLKREDAETLARGCEDRRKRGQTQCQEH